MVNNQRDVVAINNQETWCHKEV